MICRTDREVFGKNGRAHEDSLSGGFEKEEDAMEKARAVFESSDYFMESEDHYGPDAKPPYRSSSLNRYDEDEFQDILVQTKEEVERVTASQKKVVDSANAALVAKQEKKKTAVKRKRKKGEVEYNFPPGNDSPAELEISIGTDGEPYLVPRKDKLDMARHSVASPSALATAASLMIHGDPPASLVAGGSAPFLKALNALFEKCLVAEQVYWFWPKWEHAADSLLLASESTVHLRKNLKVLSLTLSSADPDRMDGIGNFEKLEVLDLRSSLNLEYGINHVQSMEENFYDDDEYGGDDGGDGAPYSMPLMQLAEDLKKLRVINLDGIMEDDQLRYCLDEECVYEIRSITGGRCVVKLGGR